MTVFFIFKAILSLSNVKTMENCKNSIRSSHIPVTQIDQLFTFCPSALYLHHLTPGSYLYSMTAYLNFLRKGSPHTMKSGGVLVRGISERLIVEF